MAGVEGRQSGQSPDGSGVGKLPSSSPRSHLIWAFLGKLLIHSGESFSTCWFFSDYCMLKL